jgi:hypothetical protein
MAACKPPTMLHTALPVISRANTRIVYHNCLRAWTTRSCPRGCRSPGPLAWAREISTITSTDTITTATKASATCSGCATQHGLYSISINSILLGISRAAIHITFQDYRGCSTCSVYTTQNSQEPMALTVPCHWCRNMCVMNFSEESKFKAMIKLTHPGTGVVNVHDADMAMYSISASTV